jgi:O-antigen ligase
MQIATDRINTLLRWCEYVYVVVVLSALTVGPVYSLWNAAMISLPIQPIDSPILATFVGVQIPAVFLLGRRWSFVGDVRQLVFWLIGLVGFLMLTAIWTDMSRFVAGDALRMGLATVTGLYVVASFGRREQIWLIWTAMQICLLASRFAISRNWLGAKAGDGDWQGIFNNPNLLGPVAAVGLVLSILTCFHFWKSHEGEWKTPLLFLLVDVMLFDMVLLYRSRSWTSVCAAMIFLIVMALGFSLSPISKVLKRSLTHVQQIAISISTAVLVIVIIVCYRFFWILPNNMKNFLAERNLAWVHSVRGIQERPFGGWGFNAAWNTLKFRKLDFWWTVEHLGHSHSAYLDILLSGGIIAGLLFLVFLFKSLWSISKEWSENVIQSFGISLTFYCLFSALFEPFIVTGYFLWPLLIIGILPSSKQAVSTDFN